MDAKQQTPSLARRVLVIAAAVVLLVGGGLAYQRITAEPEYASSVTFFIRTPAGADGSRESTAVQSEIIGTADTNTVLLTATVTDPSAERSLVIAQAVAAHFDSVVDGVDPIGDANDVLLVISGPSLDPDPV